MSQTSYPYKNKYNTRRYKKRKDTKLARVARSVAKQEIAKNEAVELEHKFHDIEVNDNPSTSGVITHLSNITQGTTYKQRIADQIKGTSIQFRYQVTVSDTTNVMRIVVFRWFEPTVPGVGDILAIGLSTGTFLPISPINVSNRKFIQVLFDNLITINSTNLENVDKTFIKRNMNIDWKTDGARNKGHLYVLTLSDSIATPHPYFHSIFRLRFTDQ